MEQYLDDSKSSINSSQVDFETDESELGSFVGNNMSSGSDSFLGFDDSPSNMNILQAPSGSMIGSKVNQNVKSVNVSDPVIGAKLTAHQQHLLTMPSVVGEISNKKSIDKVVIENNIDSKKLNDDINLDCYSVAESDSGSEFCYVNNGNEAKKNSGDIMVNIDKVKNTNPCLAQVAYIGIKKNKDNVRGNIMGDVTINTGGNKYYDAGNITGNDESNNTYAPFTVDFDGVKYISGYHPFMDTPQVDVYNNSPLVAPPPVSKEQVIHTDISEDKQTEISNFPREILDILCKKFDTIRQEISTEVSKNMSIVQKDIGQVRLNIQNIEDNIAIKIKDTIFKDKENMIKCQAEMHNRMISEQKRATEAQNALFNDRLTKHEQTIHQHHQQHEQTIHKHHQQQEQTIQQLHNEERERMVNVTKQVIEAVSNVEDKVVLIDTKFTEFRSDFDDCRTDISTLTNNIEEYKKDISTLQTDVEKCRTDVIALESNVANNAHQVELNSFKINELDKEIKEVKESSEKIELHLAEKLLNSSLRIDRRHDDIKIEVDRNSMLVSEMHINLQQSKKDLETLKVEYLKLEGKMNENREQSNNLNNHLTCLAQNMISGSTQNPTLIESLLQQLASKTPTNLNDPKTITPQPAPPLPLPQLRVPSISSSPLLSSGFVTPQNVINQPYPNQFPLHHYPRNFTEEEYIMKDIMKKEKTPSFDASNISVSPPPPSLSKKQNLILLQSILQMTKIKSR